MTIVELTMLSPLLILAGAAILILLLIAFYRHYALTVGLSGAAVVAAGGSLVWLAPHLPQQITPLIIMDEYALFYMGLLLACSLVVLLLTYGYAGRAAEQIDHHEELPLLLLLATLGALVLVVSSHFIAFFLGLELLTVSLYTLIAYYRTTERGIEAALKYLVLAAVSSAFLLFGMALVYADLGTMALNEVAALLQRTAPAQSLFLPLGLGLMVIGIGFKLAVVPFHMWTPDIYQGASAPVTAFIATVSKGGIFAFLLRYFGQMEAQLYPALFWLFALLAGASMLGGNLLALRQSNLKRLLAYSSIAHLGYALVAFLAGGSLALAAVTYYLTAYFVTILGAFGLVALLSSGPTQEAEHIDDYRGLFWRRPWLATGLTLVLLSLAGIPLTAGFIGKFYVVTAGVGATLWTLVLLLVLSSAIGLFYYLRVIVTMSLAGEPDTPRPLVPSLSLAGSLTVVVLMLLLVWFGVYPTPLIEAIEAMVGVL